ncbi:MAG: VOC family protein [Phenylobacterium sp.]
MANTQGEFIWYELLGHEPEASARFYQPILGWKAQSAGPEFGDYRILEADGVGVGGLSTCPDPATRPGWFGYIGVDDVDKTAADVVAWGGAQHVPPTDIPGVGRFAMLADPQGIVFYVMRGASPERSEAFAAEAVGHCRWNELSTPDPVAALEFYTRLGMQKGDVMPMGEMGDYQFIHAGGMMIGAIMKAAPGAPAQWNYYFGVDDIDRAAKAVEAGGGRMQQQPMEIPGGEYSMMAIDPQGASVGFVGPRK